MIMTRLVPFAAVASAGALNVFLMRGEEIRRGINVFPTLSAEEKEAKQEQQGHEVQSLGKSRKAATIAVGETALSRVLNSTPIMVLPPLLLVRLQRGKWLRERPRMVLPVNLGTFLCLSLCKGVSWVECQADYISYLIGLILTTSIFALPLALAAFPQRQAVDARSLEEEFWEKGGKDGKMEFNRGI